MSYLLGILGGLGPMSSAYLYRMITEHTKAARDQDHIDIILSSRSTTPDRTDYIMGHSSASPLPFMTEDAKKLESFGADGIVIACNTAHFFIDEVRRAVSVPVPSIISETVNFLKASGFRKAGILATTGTISAGAYQESCRSLGIDYELPSNESQNMLMELIYGFVKCGRTASSADFMEIADELSSLGCDCLILGCTELSVLAEELMLKGSEALPFLVDSLEVMACFSIGFCGKESVGFDPLLEKWGAGILGLRKSGCSFIPEVR